MCSQTVYFLEDEGLSTHNKTGNSSSRSTNSRSMKDDYLSGNAVGLTIILSTIALLINFRNGPDTENTNDVPATRYLYFLILGYACGHKGGFFTRLGQGLRMAYTRSKQVFLSLPQGPLKRSLSSAQALTQLSRVSSADTLRRLSTTIRKSFGYRRRTALKAITRKECFAKLDAVGKLSIHDLAILFRYATDVNQVDFNKKRFMADNSKLIRSMVTAMDMAANISRGGEARRSKLQGQRKQGDVDALYFLAVMRVFAEWRAQRLVPEGYNRYSVALNLAYRDVLQNLSKIEDGVHFYFKQQQKRHEEGMVESKMTSPTLRELLDFEEHAGLHPRLPRVKEKSAASGLLWTKRQLQYQTQLFANSLDVPNKFSSLEEGALAAYLEVFDEYHGWAVKQIFTHSFGGSPPLHLIWNQMCPPVGNISDDSSCISMKLSDVSDGSENLDNEFLAAIENFGREVTKRWEDFLRTFHCTDDDDDDDQNHDRSRNLIISGESYVKMAGALEKHELESLHLQSIRYEESTDSSSIQCEESTDSNSIQCEVSSDSILFDPIDDVKSGTLEFVKELQPLLTDLSCLIDELNMNDPAKV